MNKNTREEWFRESEVSKIWHRSENNFIGSSQNKYAENSSVIAIWHSRNQFDLHNYFDSPTKLFLDLFSQVS